MRTTIEKREAAKSSNIGANGFLYWASLNCYVKWHSSFDEELLDDYRYVFTRAHNYKGTTSNLGMIHTLALETALPTDFAGDTPARQLAAFREKVRQTSQVTLSGSTATFMDRDSNRLERTFDGDTRINRDRIAYETWPLLKNPRCATNGTATSPSRMAKRGSRI